MLSQFLLSFHPDFGLLQPPPTDSAQAKQLATAEKKEKNKKRKAAEGQLQIKRQEMDKAKVSLFGSFYFLASYQLPGRGRRQTLLLSFRANGAF